MKPLHRNDLRGIWATALLPVASDDRIDYGRLAADLDHLVAARPHGIYVNGSAGEFVTLSEVEFDRIGALVARVCDADNLPYQIGASHPSGQLGSERIRRARDLRPAAIQVILPDWQPLADREVLAAVQRFHELADPVPLVLYNPPHAKTQVTPELYGTLAARLPRLIGIKVAGGDEQWHARMRSAAPDLAVFVAGHRLDAERRYGARGAYSNIACLSPRGALHWYARPDAELDGRVQEFFRVAIRPVQALGYGVTAVDKLLAATGGWSVAGTGVRWPHDPVPADLVDRTRRHAGQLIPDLLLD
jgi:dihydrodipicolinate synthase/N-acetylneuraminate lyase